MLNALFGDPRIHLIQMHPSYLSKNNSHYFDKSMKLYADKEYADFKLSNECSKQRRNALTELMRQICFIEYSPKIFLLENQKLDDEAIYEKAYQMLLNG
jgi:hypothetical protein